MRIAIVSPLYESVPPRLYGGTERIVSFLTEELVRMGLDVTLYASGDSETSARLVSCAPSSLRLDAGCVDRLVHHLLMIERVVQESDPYDLIHWHVDYLHFSMSRRMRTPHVTTLHGRLDLPELVPLYREFRDIPLISISDAQRAPLPFANWQATVHHGLPLGAYPFEPRPDDYLAFLGRASPEKGLDRAIEIAGRVGLPLRIAAKVDREDTLYFERVIRPLLSRPGVEWLGELGEREKPEFLGKARALLFPIDWPEPFGLVMIEAMACGTPVVAFRRGSVSEVMEDGVTGFIVDDVDEAVHRLAELDRIDRWACRRSFERRFDARRMAEDYVDVYETLVAAGRAAA